MAQMESYEPTAEEIRQACASIQESWTDSERARRARRTVDKVRFTVPLYSVHTSVDGSVSVTSQN